MRLNARQCSPDLEALRCYDTCYRGFLSEDALSPETAVFNHKLSSRLAHLLSNHLGFVLRRPSHFFDLSSTLPLNAGHICDRLTSELFQRTNKNISVLERNYIINSLSAYFKNSVWSRRHAVVANIGLDARNSWIAPCAARCCWSRRYVAS